MNKVIIIDDESGARKVISSIINNYTDNFKVIAEADSVSSGIEALSQYSTDVVMLDINLKDGTGFDILNKISNNNFKLIFITAYDEFAIKAIKFSAYDYILKPIDPDELISTLKKIDKENDFTNDSNQLQSFLNSIKVNSNKKITLKTSDSIHILNISDIIYCKSDNNYTEFHLSNSKKILISNTLKHYENMLRDLQFVRSHQSYLVNINHILTYEKRDGGYLVVSNNDQIPVSVSKKQTVIQILENL